MATYGTGCFIHFLLWIIISAADYSYVRKVKNGAWNGILAAEQASLSFQHVGKTRDGSLLEVSYPGFFA